MDVLSDAVAGELADDPARDSPDGDQRQQRRREGPTASPTPPRLSRLVAVDVRCHDTIIGVRARDLLTRRGYGSNESRLNVARSCAAHLRGVSGAWASTDPSARTCRVDTQTLIGAICSSSAPCCSSRNVPREDAVR